MLRINHKFIFCFIFAILLMTGCSGSPDESAIQTAIAQTAAVEPTTTYTNTLSPTFTLTFTPTLTLTPTNTKTPTQTDTSTPVPPATLTQQAVELTQTERAALATSTQEAKNEAATATSEIRTETAESRNATATEIASYESVYWKELATYPEKYIGTKLKVSGRVFNIVGSNIQMYFAGTYEALYVKLKTSPSKLYDNDSITVYGIGDGEECFKNAYNATICQPALKNAWFTKP